jgi:hypothetical protein
MTNKTTIQIESITLQRLANIKSNLMGDLKPCTYDSVLNKLFDEYVDNVDKEQGK